MKLSIMFLSFPLLGSILLSCSGRTADNMKPSGETVEVNIPVEGETLPLPGDSVYPAQEGPFDPTGRNGDQ